MRISATQAASLLQQGRVVAVPTETVYGLAAKADCETAVSNIFLLKGRPRNNPLIVHVASINQLIPYIKEKPPGFDLLAQAFWPGPMTLVLNADQNKISADVRASLPTAAFRIPDHPVALELLAMTGPLVMPSANLSGKPSATAPEHVEQDFGSQFPVLEGGRCQKGIESSILMYKDGFWRIIRQGALSMEAFEAVLGYGPPIEGGRGEAPLCPGQLYRHYAPEAKLHLTREFLQGMKGVVLGYQERTYPEGMVVISLGSIYSPDQSAENLYRTLRELDQQGVAEAWVDVDIPAEGLWLTIMERLIKAASK
jgi:L-threonylcarbamoyladenylate synthase